MPQYLLDTNILSYLAKNSYLALSYRFRSMPKESFIVSAVSEAEIRFGLALLPPEAKQHRITELFLNGIAVQPWDSFCAKRYAPLAAEQKVKGAPLGRPDTMIAAHALAYSYTLITHDQAFFRIPTLTVEDWTEGPFPA